MMTLAQLKQEVLKASVEGNPKEVARLTRKMFEKIIKRKSKGKSFEARHILK